MRRLVNRGQFLKAARGARMPRRGFVLQSIESGAPEAGLGLTVTKRTGNAPERNRIRRRLKAAADANAAQFAPGHDYVLIGRRDALHEPFERLVSGMQAALAQAHASRTAPDPKGSR